ncbi:MAG: DegT/DnrJ/EryC1/StrS family aminotransferase [Planctomycetota bacterium]
MPRNSFLPFALPDFDEIELKNIREVLDSGWVTTGPKTKQFEQEFAAIVNARHAVAVNSCTAAMHLALEAINLQRGDEVITTPYTFAATTEVILYFGARPIFVDVNAETLNINAARIEEVVTPRTKAIIPVHIAGLSADMDEIHKVAAKRKLRVIEDAAHAFPARYRNRMIGTISDFTCFSFYATKTITTGEGGMITTNDDALADRCRIMSLHGISHDAWNRYTEHGSWFYEIIAPGYKYNMTDIAAAMGLAQLSKFDRMWQRRRIIASRYSEAFSDVPELQIPPDKSDGQHAQHLYLLRLNLPKLSIHRAQFIEHLKTRNIGASVHFIPLHIHPYYRKTFDYKDQDFPIALREYERVISLPIYSKMLDGDIQDVIDGVLDIVQANRR